MRQRLPLFVLLASALTFLASLYLPWRTVENAPGDFDGWGALPSYAAALLAIALALGAAVALLQPHRATSLPLGGLGLSLGYLAAAAAIQLTEFSIPVGTYPGPRGWTGYGTLHWSWSYGAYLGGAAGAAAALAALALRRRELVRHRTAAEAIPLALALGLLVSFLLPWQTTGAIRVVGLASPAAAVAAAGLFLAGGRLPRTEPRLRLLTAVGLAVLTGATASGLGTGTHYVYGAWIGIGCAVALVALEASRAGAYLRRPEPLRRWAALRSGAALLLLVALFLPWQVFHVSGGSAFSTVGWQAITGTAAGTISLLLLAAPVFPWVETYALEAAFGVALLVATLGIEIAGIDIPDLTFGAGAYLGFVAATFLLVAELGGRRWPVVDRRRALMRVVPVIASLACVGAAVVPAWQGVLPGEWLGRADAVRNWFSVAALMLALHVLRLWIARIGSPSAPSRGLVLTPLLILPLPALELIRERADGVVWGGLILVCLCLLLAALGWIEQRGGLERVGVPELLRVDRLPNAES